MAGIVSYGAHIPLYRLSLSEVNRAWGKSAGMGERAIANWDEDSLTMGVEAATDCLKSMDRELVDALYFASTTPVYREKQTASILAAVIDLKSKIFAVDITDSLRSATAAMKSALDAVSAGPTRMALVVASDLRIPPPNSVFETNLGDGAAALLLGKDNVIAEIEGSYAVSSNFIDIWKRDEDTYIRTWEDRFVNEEGYMKILPQAVSGLMAEHNLTPKDFDRAIFQAPDIRNHQRMARKLGFDIKDQVQDPLFTTVGNTGTSSVPMMLVATLEVAKPGDRLLLANYGDGADAYILRITDRIEKLKNRRGVKRNLESKMMIPNYGKYIQFRNLMKWEEAPGEVQTSSLNILWRDRKWVFSGKGQRCRACGHIQYPMQRICMWCQAKDNFDEVRLAEEKGTLYTFSMDERAPVIDLPNVISVVDLECGGRIYSSMTDRDPNKLEVGMPMELTFRKLHEGNGFHNYFWKTRPVRG